MIEWRIVLSVMVGIALWEVVRFVIGVGGGLAGLALWDIVKAVNLRRRNHGKPQHKR